MIPNFGRRRVFIRRGMRGLGQGSYAACAATCANSPAGMAYCLQNCQQYAESAGLPMTPAPGVAAPAVVPALPTTRVGWRNRRTAAGYHPLATQGAVAAAQNPGMVVSSPVSVAALAPSAPAVNRPTINQGNPLERVVGQTYTSSIEGWASQPNGSDQMASLTQCWSNIQVLGVLTSLDSSTAAGQAAIQRQFNFDPTGAPRRYFVVVQFRAIWTGGPGCVF